MDASDSVSASRADTLARLSAAIQAQVQAQDAVEDSRLGSNFYFDRLTFYLVFLPPAPLVEHEVPPLPLDRFVPPYPVPRWGLVSRTVLASLNTLVDSKSEDAAKRILKLFQSLAPGNSDIQDLSTDLTKLNSSLFKESRSLTRWTEFGYCPKDIVSHSILRAPASKFNGHLLSIPPEFLPARRNLGLLADPEQDYLKGVTDPSFLARFRGRFSPEACLSASGPAGVSTTRNCFCSNCRDLDFPLISQKATAVDDGSVKFKSPELPESLFQFHLADLLGQYCNMVADSEIAFESIIKVPQMPELRKKILGLNIPTFSENTILVPVVFYSDGFRFQKDSLDHLFAVPLLFWNSERFSFEQLIAFSDSQHFLRCTLAQIPWNAASAREVIDLMNTALVCLFERGMEFHPSPDETYILRPFLAGIIGDIPAISHLSGCPGHRSLCDSCWMCDIQYLNLEARLEGDEITGQLSDISTDITRDVLFPDDVVHPRTALGPPRTPDPFLTVRISYADFAANVLQSNMRPFACPDAMHIISNVFERIFIPFLPQSVVENISDFAKQLHSKYANDFDCVTLPSAKTAVKSNISMYLMPILLRNLDPSDLVLSEKIVDALESGFIRQQTAAVVLDTDPGTPLRGRILKCLNKIADSWSLFVHSTRYRNTIAIVELLSHVTIVFRRCVAELCGNHFFQYLPVHFVGHIPDVVKALYQLPIFTCWAFERKVRDYFKFKRIGRNAHRSMAFKFAITDTVQRMTTTLDVAPSYCPNLRISDCFTIFPGDPVVYRIHSKTTTRNSQHYNCTVVPLEYTFDAQYRSYTFPSNETIRASIERLLLLSDPPLVHQVQLRNPALVVPDEPTIEVPVPVPGMVNNTTLIPVGFYDGSPVPLYPSTLLLDHIHSFFQGSVNTPLEEEVE